MPDPTLAGLTTANVKAFHGIAAADTTKDARIDLIRPAVADMIINYCRHDFESKTRTSEKPYIEPMMGAFYTKYRPVASVTSLVEDSITLVEDTDFYIDKDTGKVEKIKDRLIFSNPENFGNWTTTKNAIVITYVGGEVLTYDVIMVFYELCGIYAQLKNKTFITNEGIEQSITITSIPPNMMEILERHKWYRV